MQRQLLGLLNGLSTGSRLLMTTIILFSLQLALQAQPFPSDDDDGMQPPPPMSGMGEGRRQGRMQQQLVKNFSWETAEKNLLPLIKKENQQLYLFILANRNQNTPVSKRVVRGLAIMSMGQEDHPEEFKEMFKMGLEDLDTERLAALYHQESSDSKKADLKNQIRVKLTHSFDQKEKMRAEIIKRLEEHLKRQKSEFQKRQDKKTKIVDKRLKKMLEDSDDLDW